MIDRGDIRPGNRPLQQYLGFIWALVMVDSTPVTAWLHLKKRAERSERLKWAESPRLSPLLVICIIVCLSWAVNHYRDNAITYKPQRDKYKRTEALANAAITDMQMRQRDNLLRSLQHCTKELADAKAENDALRDDVAAGRRRLHIKAVCPSVRERTASIGRQPPPTGRHRWTGLFHPQREGWSLCKNNWKEPRSILMTVQIELPLSDGQLMCQPMKQYTRASSGV